MLEHLNLMKNPCNPVFSNELFYQEFRAKFSIWIPSLRTLDGTDFKEDQGFITKMRGQENEKKLKMANGGQLETIPEEGGSSKKDATLFPQGIDKSIKAKAGNTEF